MVAKPKAKGPKKPKEKPQKQRFIEAAKQLGSDETGAEFERAMERLGIAGPESSKPAKIR